MSTAGRIAVIGLGAMGLPIAAKLLGSGFDVLGLDLSEGARRRFADLGGSVLAEADAMPCDVAATWIVVVNAGQVRDVLFGRNGIAATLTPGRLIIVSATIGPADAREIGARLLERGVHPVEAPVSGGVKRARSGDLSVIAAGDPDDLSRARPFLLPISREIFYAGREFGSACAIKLLNQMLCGVHLAIAAETTHLADRLGLDLDLFYRVVTQSSGNSYMFADRVPQMHLPPDETNSAVDIFLKDLRLALDAGSHAGAPTLLTAAAETVFAGASRSGLGAQNDSQIIQYLRNLTTGSEARTTSMPAGLEVMPKAQQT